MNFYKLAKRFIGLKSPRLKLLLLMGSNFMRMRNIGVFLDPVLTCNLRCKMCYFSDDESRPKPVAPMTREYIGKLKKRVFPRALKLQLGCGAEPTLYTDLPRLISDARQAGIPYIEMTTNGQLLDYPTLSKYAEAGLNGLTLSLHGTTPEIYEFLMGRAKFDRLLTLIDSIKRIQNDHPGFKLRINYTFNNLNVNDLAGLWNLFNGVRIDVLQIRPIQKIGETLYNDFDLQAIIDDYDRLIKPVEEECRRRGVMYIGPTREDLSEVNDQRDDISRTIEDVTYCYVSPVFCYKEDFNLDTDSITSYNRRKGLNGKLLRKAFGSIRKQTSQVVTTKKLNYTIK